MLFKQDFVFIVSTERHPLLDALARLNEHHLVLVSQVHHHSPVVEYFEVI